jgi:hypothetical protein
MENNLNFKEMFQIFNKDKRYNGIENYDIPK